MPADSSQRFIKRNRPPRVHITYQNPNDGEKLVELPFVMGVMSDLSGNASENEKAPLAKRDFTDLDMDNFDKYMASVEPAVTFRAENRLGEGGGKLNVKLTFREMADLDPAAIARQVPALKTLIEARDQLSHLLSYMDGKVAAEDRLRELLSKPELMQALSARNAGDGKAESQT